MKTIRWLLCAAMFMSTCMPARGQEPSAVITIQQAVSEALDRNLTLLAERFNVSVADAAIVTASLRPNPVVTVSDLHPNQALFNAGASPDDQTFRTDYVIERGDKRARRIEQATLAKSVAQLNLLETTRTLVLDVESAFVEVQLAKANVTLAQENLAAFNSLVSINEERVRTGDLAGVELSRSQLAALQFQNDVAQQQVKLQLARTRLSQLIGRGPNGALDVSGDFRVDPQPRDLEQLRQRALDQRPDIRAARTDQARSVADLRLQLANGQVDLTVSGEYHRQESPAAHGNAGLVALSVPLPVFNRNQGEIARARLQQQQLETKRRAVEDVALADVTNAFSECSTARAIVDRIEREMLTRATDVRSTTEYSYRRGEASLVEFLDAVRAFNETMQGYNEARAEYAKSLYTLDAVTGQVTP